MAKEKNTATGIAQLKKIKHRSPNYPAIGLEKALEKTATIHEHGKLHFIPVSAARQMWNYKMAAGDQTVAALKAFGLIEVTGERENRRLRVTDSARKILGGYPDQDALLKEAAIKPELHGELWSKYRGDLPADSIIRSYLVFERKFNEDSVDNFIAQFRSTIAFAKLDLSDNTSDEVKNEAQWKGVDTDTPALPSGKGLLAKQPTHKRESNVLGEDETELKFNISQNSKARIIFSGRVTQEAIELLAELLNLQKRTFPKEADLKLIANDAVPSEDEAE